MRGIAAIALVASACVQQGKDVRQAHLTALAQATVAIAAGADGQLHATLDFPGGAYAKTCTVLAPDIEATWGGVAVTTIARGDVGVPGQDACDLPDLTLPALDASQSALDSLVDLTLYDATGEVHLVAVGPLAPRALVPDGGKIVAGTTAVVRWTSATDTWLSVNAKDGGDGIMFECDDPSGNTVFLASTVDPATWPALHVTGDVFSFEVVDNSPYTGTMSCKLSAIAYAQIAQCDFAGCEDRIALPTNNLDYYLFTLEM